MAAHITNPTPAIVDPQSGFCKSNSIFYSKRKPVALPPNDSLNVTTYISSQAHRGHVAFIDAATGRQLTYAALWQAVDSVASSLSDMGVRKGHVILILSPNSIFFHVVCLAVMSIGAVITTANPLNTPQEIAKQIADSKPFLAFTTAQLIPKLAASPLSKNNSIILMDDDAGVITNNDIMVYSSLGKMMKRQPNGGRFMESIDQNDTATLLYSSGTTGPSKGVVSCHRNVIATIRTIYEGNITLVSGVLQTCLCTVPMFHIFGLMWVASFLTTGSTIVVLSRFDMHDMLSAIERYRVTCVPLVPPILMALVNGAEGIKDKYDLSSLHTAVCGGAPLGKKVIEGFLEKYPTVGICQGYALTESGTGASTNSMEESRRYGTAGMLSASMEAKIVDPGSGDALAVNQTGELWLKGPAIMKEYLGNAEATAATLDSEGWLRTGDLCYIDDDGFVFVVDRLKELIKYKAFQVPPAELEALLLTHPQIADAAVIPFPDEKVGQFPMAYVVRKAGSNLSETEIMDFIAKQVAPYKRIRRVAFIGSVPKNPSGKILRKDLIQLATSSSSKL